MVGIALGNILVAPAAFADEALAPSSIENPSTFLNLINPTLISADGLETNANPLPMNPVTVSSTPLKLEMNGVFEEATGASSAFLAKDKVVAPVVVSPSASKGFSIERASVTSEAKPEPKPKPKPAVELEADQEVPEAVASNSSKATVSTGTKASANVSNTPASTSRKATIGSQGIAVTARTSDAYTSETRAGKKVAHKDAGIKLDTTSEGKGMSAVVKAAYAGIGNPYVWGGNTPSGWDCSGFTKWAYAKAGVNIARTTGSIRASGQFQKTSNPQPGDLVFQNGGSHVGIYVGGGKMIGAQNPSVGTILHSVDRNPVMGYYTLKK